MYRYISWVIIFKYKLFKNNQPILQVKINPLNLKKNKITCISSGIDDLNDLEFISSRVYYYNNRKLSCKVRLFNRLRFLFYIDTIEVGKAYYTQPWFEQETRNDIELFIPEEFLLPFLILISQVIPLTA